MRGLSGLTTRPPVPATVDPDRWIDSLDGHCFVRKVRANTSVSIDEVIYYTTTAVIGQYVTLRVDAATRTLVVEHQGREIKRVSIHGTGQGRIPFETFVEQLCAEARTGRRGYRLTAHQLPLPL
jgi:hypothetical protein